MAITSDRCSIPFLLNPEKETKIICGLGIPIVKETSVMNREDVQSMVMYKDKVDYKGSHMDILQSCADISFLSFCSFQQMWTNGLRTIFQCSLDYFYLFHIEKFKERPVRVARIKQKGNFWTFEFFVKMFSVKMEGMLVSEKQISIIPMESDDFAWCLQILELVGVLERSGQRFQLFRIFGNPSWVNLVAKGSASKQRLIKLLLRKVQASFLQILAQVGTIVRPRQELHFFEFLGLPGRVDIVTKDLTHPNIFYKPLIREVQAWILRSFSVVKALQRPEQNYQNSGFFRRTWRGCSGDQGPRARANFEKAVLQIYPGVVYTK